MEESIEMEYPASIIKAIHEIMQKVGYVQKKDVNKFHQYKYAGESALLEVLRPAMIEAGLILIPSGKTLVPIDEYGNTHITMEYTLAHTDGSVWPEKLCAFGAGGDKNSKGGVGDKGTYKAITGAGKYMLFKLFLIETGDDPENDNKDKPDRTTKTKPSSPEPTGDSPAVVSKVKAEAFLNYAHALKIPEEKVNEFLTNNFIESVYHIPVDRYDRLREGLKSLKEV